MRCFLTVTPMAFVWLFIAPVPSASQGPPICQWCDEDSFYDQDQGKWVYLHAMDSDNGDGMRECSYMGSGHSWCHASTYDGACDEPHSPCGEFALGSQIREVDELLVQLSDGRSEPTVSQALMSRLTKQVSNWENVQFTTDRRFVEFRDCVGATKAELILPPSVTASLRGEAAPSLTEPKVRMSGEPAAQ